MATHLRLLVTLLIAFGLIGFAVWRSSKTAVPEVPLLGFQDADVPLEMPAAGDPDMRFQFLTAWQRSQIPTADRFDPPLGSEHSALVYNAQKFWEMNEDRGGHHTGDDLNGIGGMNTDLGDPVFAAADGLVIYTGEPSPGWGNIVVLAHADPDGRPLHSMYAHLHAIETRVGSLVGRGSRIATVGTANGHYPAHLHFEIRVSDGVDIGAGYSMSPLNWLDPLATIAEFRNNPEDNLAPNPLALVINPDKGPWTRIEIEGAEHLPGLGD